MQKCVLLLMLFGAPLTGAAQELPQAAEAVQKALPLLAVAAQGTADQKTCFTCHGQAMPVFALAAARDRGLAIDEETFKKQVEHTLAFIKTSHQRFLDGRGTGGKVDTAGYAMWTLEEGGVPRDENTDAVIDYIVGFQAPSPFWRASSQRLPSEGSYFTTTYLALRALGAYASPKHRARQEERQAAAEEWLLKTQPKHNEDRVFRLRSMHYLGLETKAIDEAAQDLLGQQREDGGWAQSADMESDAYATGSALTALAESGAAAPSDPAYQRGVAFLLKSQQTDGSWHVATHSRPIQKYFETGFPHAKDQFISTSATAWAVLALVQTLPPADKRAAP